MAEDLTSEQRKTLKYCDKLAQKTGDEETMPFHIRPAVRGFGIINKYTNDKAKAAREAERAEYHRLLYWDQNDAKKANHDLKFHDEEIDDLKEDYLYHWPTIPQRSTDGSAGYDIRSAETIEIQSIPYAESSIAYLRDVADDDQMKPLMWNLLGSRKHQTWGAVQPTLVHTGIKAYMPSDETLEIFNRSSNPVKRGLYLVDTGIVDSDFYDSDSSEGELLIAFVNLGKKNYTIHRGDRIAQGIFTPYLTTDNDSPVSHYRLGGWGSTGK